MFRVQMISGGIGAYQRDFEKKADAIEVAQRLGLGKTRREVEATGLEIYKATNRSGSVIRVVTI